MGQKVFLVHGWSVTDTTTYRSLHHKLAEYGFELNEVHLGRYVSLDDHVEIKDLARAMHAALEEHLGEPPWKQTFHFITHSTGALVVKQWVAEHYVGLYSRNKALRNIVFLAGPHFGSRLAHHGRSMLAHARYLGDTGNSILKSLELGSEFSWRNNEVWFNRKIWHGKGIRPFCLIGDKVERSIFGKVIFPAAYEQGSDMVVRVAAGNLNARRYRLDARQDDPVPELVGEISEVPFAALPDYVHSGPDVGIMNSIGSRARRDMQKYRNLDLILTCLEVRGDAEYANMSDRLADVSNSGRTRKHKFAQLDMSFRDDTGSPIDDYSFTLGERLDNEDKPASFVAHLHKNKVTPSHLTVFFDLAGFNPEATYFLKFDSRSATELYHYEPDPFQVNCDQQWARELLRPDETTQLEVILRRTPGSNLFVFHQGTDPELHVKWNRKGEITKSGLDSD